MNQLLTGEAVLHGKAACFSYGIWVYLYHAEFQYASIMCGGNCSWWALRMSSIKLFDINLPLLSVGWRKWFAAQSASGLLAMLRCIVRQSFANRTRQVLKLTAAVEHLHKARIEKNWWCGMGCMPIFFSLVWLGFKVWYRFSGSPALLPVLDKQTTSVQNELPTLGKSATYFG